MPDTLLIYEAGTAGPVVAVAACNEKSRTKSLERGELWIVDPATGRVLPFAQGGVRYDRFQERDSWWEVRVLDSGASSAADISAAATPPGASSAASGADASGAFTDSSQPTSGSQGSGASVSAASTETVLSALSEIIAERHRTLPEGSYTTHLFSKGPEKIRKKVGEEAVELILAATPEEIRSEGADLIYHMMVLLEAEGLRMDEVLAELDRRHRQG
ncbi:MAG: phosphoribosyl-ATP diphosphatase [Alkalispirochaeta sp.]